MLNGAEMRPLKGGPLPAEGINAARPLPRKRGQERELPLLSEAAVTTEVTTEPDEDVKKK